ncbi:hypothetical protein PG993_008005 [Apiospora rasikravindrae]|uniref:Myb-like DNA-binding domain-containing protein n=1 Tax=Apiospora rasikravindrae TaxID=990691 RepID=A0ABR1SZ37_9PEZI
MASSNVNANMPKATDQEARFFFVILKNMKTQPQVDWDAVAKEAGYNSGSTAVTRFGQIKKRLGLTTAKYGPSPAKAPTKVTKRGGKSNPVGRAKRTKTVHDDADDVSDDGEDFPVVKKEIKAEEEEKKVNMVDEV